MRRRVLATLGLLAAGWWLGGSPQAAAADDDRAEVNRIVERYTEARGGTERWRAARSLQMRGTYAAFSDYEPFTLVRSPQNLYRIEFTVLGGTAIRARDSKGPWWQHPLLQPEPARLEEGPYKAQVERESHFAPLLLDYEARGIGVELLGPTEVEGIPVLSLQVTLPGGAVESWYLDADSGLEVAIDSQVNDFTQSGEAMRQRAFFDDFRDVGGLIIPFSIDYEFGHRLESLTVEEARVGVEIDSDLFSPPAGESAGE